MRASAMVPVAGSVLTNGDADQQPAYYHLYEAAAQTPVASWTGDTAGYMLESGSVQTRLFVCRVVESGE